MLSGEGNSALEIQTEAGESSSRYCTRRGGHCVTVGTGNDELILDDVIRYLRPTAVTGKIEPGVQDSLCGCDGLNRIGLSRNDRGCESNTILIIDIGQVITGGAGIRLAVEFSIHTAAEIETGSNHM